MGRLTVGRFSCLVFLITGLAGGIMLGAIAATAYAGHELDRAYNQVSYLQIALKEKDERLKKLEDLSNPKKHVVRNIEIMLQFDGDDLEKTYIVQAIKNKYFSVVGKEIRTIDPDLLPEVIDNAILQINKRSFKVTVQKIVLSEVLKIWAAAAPLKE